MHGMEPRSPRCLAGMDGRGPGTGARLSDFSSPARTPPHGRQRTDDDVCPAQRVIDHAMANGPATGWKDGWLTLESGFLEPVPGTSMTALRHTDGRHWLQVAAQLPSLVSNLAIRLRISQMPLVQGHDDSIPPDALVAADVILSTLAAAFSWEWRRAYPDKSWMLGHLPECILMPWRAICNRLGMRDVGLSFNALIGGRYAVIDPTLWSIDEPYAARIDNLKIEPEVFGNREEHVFLGCIVESLSVFALCIPALVRCQQCVAEDNAQGCYEALRIVKLTIDRMVKAFHKISPNPSFGAMHVDPIIWGKTVAPLNAPINPEANSPGGSGLYVPLFHALDAFLGRTNYNSSLGVEALHLRSWFPPNWKKFIDALADPLYSIRAYAEQVEERRSQLSGVKLPGLASWIGAKLPPLRRMYRQTLESYAGERGWMGTHRYKVFGFLQLVFKTGRSSTNGGTMDQSEQPWEAVHSALQQSRVERLPEGRPETGRGSSGECPFFASIVARDSICNDPSSRTSKVTLSLPNGLEWAPGDRLMVVVPNRDDEVLATIRALRRGPKEKIHLDARWRDFFAHYGEVFRQQSAAVKASAKSAGLEQPPVGPQVLLHELVKFAVLRPLGHAEVKAIRKVVAQSPGDPPDAIEQILSGAPCWPVATTIADLLLKARPLETTELFLVDTDVCEMLLPQRIRTYSISNAPSQLSQGEHAAHVELTVTRQDFSSDEQLARVDVGVASGHLNPAGQHSLDAATPAEGLMVGVQSPISFSLPPMAGPIVMFAAGSGIAPFRAFLQAREASLSESWLLFGCRDEASLLYRDEMDAMVRQSYEPMSGCSFKPYICFSREVGKRVEFGSRGLEVVQGESRGRYVADMLEDLTLGASLIELLLPSKMGGRGGSFYVCGSVPFFQGLMTALKKLIASFGGAPTLIDEVFSERRFMVEVFSSAKRLSPDGKVSHADQSTSRQVWQSELAQHNAATDGGRFWLALLGFVYDVTDLMDTHPGGQRIVKDMCGLDATKSFQLVSHDVNNEVMGRMATYQVGVLHKLSGKRFQDTNLVKRLDQRVSTALAQLMDGMNKIVCEFVELQNCYANDFSSILQNKRDEKIVWRKGVSWQDVLPILSFCDRFLKLLDVSKGALGCEAAAGLRSLAHKVLGVDEPKVRSHAYAWSESPDLGDIKEYVGIILGFSYELQGVSCVAERLGRLSYIDADAAHSNLMSCSRAALETIQAVKVSMIKALVPLEHLYAAALEGQVDGLDFSSSVTPSIALPDVINRIIGKGFVSAMGNIIDPVSQVLSGALDLHASATLTELRKMQVKKAPTQQGTDPMLQDTIDKIESWRVVSLSARARAATIIVRAWRHARIIRFHAATSIVLYWRAWRRKVMHKALHSR